MKPRPVCIVQIVPGQEKVPGGAFAGEVVKLMFCQSEKTVLSVRSFHAQELAAGSSESHIADSIKKIWDARGIVDPRVIVSLPRQYVTLRSLKVPSISPAEIKRIVALQASKYLPYAPADLVTGFQVISTDAAGYAMVSLVVAHKDVVARYERVLLQLGVRDFAIGLSSYALISVCAQAVESYDAPVCIIDIDAAEAEIAIAQGGKLLVSRSFKLDRRQHGWHAALMEQMRKTQDVYTAEGLGPAPSRVVLVGPYALTHECAAEMQKNGYPQAETVSYWQNMELSSEARSQIDSSGYSYASLAGFAASGVHDHFNLVSIDARARSALAAGRQNMIKRAVFVCIVLALCGLAAAKSIHNQQQYLVILSGELRALEARARPLEDLRQKFAILQSRRAASASSLEMVRELPQVLPPDVVLISLSFEDRKQMVVRGQSPEMARVFTLVSNLEQSPAFKEYTMKIQYATKRAAESREVVDFEIVCVKR